MCCSIGPTSRVVLVQEEACDHDQNHQCVDLKKHSGEDRDAHFGELEKVERGLFHSTCPLDMRGTVTQVVGKAGS